VRSTEFSYKVISLPPKGGNLANENPSWVLTQKKGIAAK